jgi:hypothetical protein
MYFPITTFLFLKTFLPTTFLFLKTFLPTTDLSSKTVSIKQKVIQIIYKITFTTNQQKNENALPREDEE